MRSIFTAPPRSGATRRASRRGRPGALRDRRGARPGRPSPRPRARAGASSSSRLSSAAARLLISSAAPSRCGWPRWRSRSSGGCRCSQRSSVLSAPRASASSSAEPARSSGSRRASASGERPRSSTRTTSSSPGAPAASPRARPSPLRRDRRARGRDVGEAQPLESHRREGHELDLRPPARVDLDDERALRARLADIVRREAARIPGRRLRAHRLALVHVAERPVGVAAVEILGRAGGIALARARGAVDLRMQDGDRGGARRPRQQLGEIGALGRARVTHCDHVPERRTFCVGELDDDGLVRQRERAARFRERRECRPRIVVAARDDDGGARLRHERELRERVMQRRRPDLAALEEVAGDHEGVRLPLDRECADAREGLALGGADASPDPASRLAHGASRWQSAVWTIRSMGVAA